MLVALALSLLLHLLLLEPRWMLAPSAPSNAPVLQARLERLQPLVPSPLPSPRPQTAKRRSQPPADGPRPPVGRHAHAVRPAPLAPQAAVPDDGDHGPPEQTSAPAGANLANAAAPPAPNRLNRVPARLQITYRIRYGPARGQQILEWAVDGEHYTLSTVIRATGLVALFYRGSIVQISRGRIGPQGLTPEEFWDERGEYFAQARFDYAAHEVMLQSSRGVRRYPISGEIQDVLSLLLQVALTAPPPPSAQVELFNSKKVRHYLIRALGEETLDTPLGRIDTLHLAKVSDKPGDETFDIWLAPAYHYLPVKIVRGDPEGLDISLLAEKISAARAPAASRPQPDAENPQPVRPAASAVRPSDTAP